jgi:hypothetical protein
VFGIELGDGADSVANAGVAEMVAAAALTSTAEAATVTNRRVAEST